MNQTFSDRIPTNLPGGFVVLMDDFGSGFSSLNMLRIREFLNDTVYTDSMLNHIIDPAAIYSVHGEDIDIIRFNQMFYHAVNVPDFTEKLLSIQKVMPEKEVPVLYSNGEYSFEVTAHGLEHDLGLSGRQLEEELRGEPALTMMMPADTSSRAAIPFQENASPPSFRNSAESRTPMTGLMKPSMDTRLTGLCLRRMPHSV